MSTPSERRIDALDVPQAVLEARLRAGRLAEYAHLLHDADPDSTVPTFPDLAKGRVVDLDYTRSVRDGFVTPVDWDDCEPAFVDRPVADVQTGGVL